jgi:hypothetical protein
MPIEQTHELPELTDEQEGDLLRRAKAAWAATGEPGAPTARGGVEVVDGLGYVVLYGRGDVLAVYRVRPDNLLLRRLKRWPVGVAGRTD